MPEIPEELRVARSENAVNTGRRGFVKGAAGLLGAMAVAPAIAEGAAAQEGRAVSRQAHPDTNRQEQVPVLDLRDPVSYSGVADATRVLMDHFKALGQRDIKGVADTLHFPYGTFEQSEAVLVKTVDDFLASPPASVNMTTNPERFTDHDGFIRRGSYDVFGGIEVFNCDRVQVNMAMTYDRYSASGNRLLQCQGI